MSRLRAFVQDQEGATAIEFALVASMLVLTMVFIMIAALIAYMNQALDYATQKAARQVMTGAVQTSGMSQANFRTNVLCTYLPAAMDCNSVIVNLYTVTAGTKPSGYYPFVNASTTALNIPPLSNASGAFQLGSQGVYQYLLVIYPVTFIPSAFASILGTATYNGNPAYLAMSTAAFRNEQY